jgi:hypothetical protein
MRDGDRQCVLTDEPATAIKPSPEAILILENADDVTRSGRLPAPADFIQMLEQVVRIFEHAIRTRPLQFLEPVPAR